MKTIIAGSRGIDSNIPVCEAIESSGFQITEVVSGRARGVDLYGELWARNHGIPIRFFEPDWNKHGKSAGMIRNAEMASYADALIAVWDGQSRGTKNMIENAKKRGLKVFVLTLDLP